MADTTIEVSSKCSLIFASGTMMRDGRIAISIRIGGTDVELILLECQFLHLAKRVQQIKEDYEAGLKAEGAASGEPVSVSTAIRPLYEEVKSAMAEGRIPRDAKAVLEAARENNG